MRTQMKARIHFETWWNAAYKTVDSSERFRIFSVTHGVIESSRKHSPTMMHLPGITLKKA